MTFQVFYRKWRPQIFADVVGQEQVTRTLQNGLQKGHISHAYLFCGPRGTGKTSTGRILAKAVNCLSNGSGEPCNNCQVCLSITKGNALDMVEIDAASNRGIDDIRELRERVNYSPNIARYKVYIVDEVHMLTKEASNALLKTLEEPPSHVIFILATTEAHKVLPTIQSRCQRFDFKRISESSIVNKLNKICQAETIYIESDGLKLITKNAKGSLRDAENLLEQLTTYYGSEISLHQVRALLGITGDWRIQELTRHLINEDLTAGITTINNVNTDGIDLRQFSREMVEYLRELLLVKTGTPEINGVTAEELIELKELAAKASLSHILNAVRQFGQLNLSLDNYSTLPLELAFIDCILSTETGQYNKQKQKPIPIKDTPTTTPKIEANIPASESTPTDIKIQPTKDKTEPTIIPTSETNQSLPIEIQTLREGWKQLINEAPAAIAKTPAAALLRSAKPVNIERDVVILSFKYPLHKENMEKPENQRIATQIISNFLGHSCQIRCIHQPEDNHLVQAALRMGAKITQVEGT